MKEHNCRGIISNSRYQTRCPQKIDPEKYEQGVRYCRRHLDQQGDNDEASSTDSQGEEQTAVSSGQEDNVDGAFKMRHPHPAPFVYIGNSTQYPGNPQNGNPQATGNPQHGNPQHGNPQHGNPQATDNRPSHRNSTKEPKQREVKPHQTSISFRLGHDHNSSSRYSVRGSDGKPERQESDPRDYRSIAAQAPTSQEDDLKRRLRSQSEVPRVAPQRHQGVTFQSSRPRHSGSPSQYKQQSVPLYPALYKPAAESSIRPVSHVESPQKVNPSLPSTAYTRNQQSDLNTSSDRAEPRSLHQPLSVYTPANANTNTQPTPTQREQWPSTSQAPTQREQWPSTSQAATQREQWPSTSQAPTQRDRRPQTSQDQVAQAQALDRTSSTRGPPVFPAGLPTDQFSFDIAGHRQTRVSPAQIQQQYAVVKESWQKFSAEVEDLISMLRLE